MGSAIVVDLGSSTIKCGLAHSFLSETQPGVVRKLSCVTPSLAQGYCCAIATRASRGAQVTSSWVSNGQQPSGGQSAADRLQAVRRGVVTDWAALERILYDALYMKVPTAVHVLTIRHRIIHFPYCILNTHMCMVQAA